MTRLPPGERYASDDMEEPNHNRLIDTDMDPQNSCAAKGFLLLSGRAEGLSAGSGPFLREVTNTLTEGSKAQREMQEPSIDKNTSSVKVLQSWDNMGLQNGTVRIQRPSLVS